MSLRNKTRSPYTDPRFPLSVLVTIDTKPEIATEVKRLPAIGWP
jgi:hypothetical protein